MKTKTKKIIGSLVLLLQFAVMVPAIWADDRPMETRKLLITAYYSPLPGQSFYMRGTYEADIRLNGRGTNGADGTEVYVGMLAAPKTYPFGTRVKLPGLGVGEVHDRGGAILAHADYDRIDIWMGHGEEGLSRALNWGARMLYGDVYFTPHQIEPGLNYSWVSDQLPQHVENRLRNKTLANSGVSTPVAQVTPPKTPAPAPLVSKQDSVIANAETRKEIQRLNLNRNSLQFGLGLDAEGKEVSDLQLALWDLGYFDGHLTGVYDESTMNAVYDFQVKKEVVGSEWDAGAGYFGKQTLASIQGTLDNKMKVLEKYPKEAQVWVPAKKVLPEIASLEVEKVAKERQELFFNDSLVNKNSVQDIALDSTMDLNSEGDQVKLLQDILITYGHLEDGLNTGYYGYQTQKAVTQFQIKQGIISSAQDLGAGRVGPKTLQTLNSI